MAGPVRHGVAFVVAAATLAVGTALLAQQPPRATPPRSPAPPVSGSDRGTATLGGRVLSIDGAPLRGVEITATRDATTAPSRVDTVGNGRFILDMPASGFRAITDVEGRYQIANLAGGRWTVTATKAGYVLPRPSIRVPSQPLKQVQIVPGQPHTVDFDLSPGGALTGVIIDESGEPLAGVKVSAARSRTVRGRRVVDAAIVTETTDDVGAYRLHSLPAGNYYVSALLTESTTVAVGAFRPQPTFYPGATNAADAMRIAVRPGEDRGGLDFAAVVTRPVEISGTLTDASGRTIKDVAVELLSALDYSVVSRSYGNFGMSQENGAFSFVSTEPGSYLLYARTETTEPQTALLPLMVGGSDIAGVNLQTSRGTRLAGSVTLPPGTKLPPGAAPMVVARAVRDDRTQTSPLDERGQFVIAGLVGAYQIEVDRLPEGWMIDAVVMSGQAVADRLIDFGSVERATATVTITNLAPSVQGRVSGSMNTTSATIVIFSADAERWPYPSRFVQAVRADSDGRFAVRSLPPDERYLAVAVEGMNEGDAHDPELLERFRPHAVGFSLRAAERKQLELEVSRP